MINRGYDLEMDYQCKFDMKLHILSDLHLEFENFSPPETDADVVILAGDIHVGLKAISWAQTRFPHKPVIYILGNHEYYGKAFPKHLVDLKKLTEGTNIIVLEKDCLKINDVLFMGCTLWTDFKLFGDPRIAGIEATRSMNDYRKIRVSPEYRKLRSVDTAVIHNQSIRWLNETLQSGEGRKVIITHHAPSPRSLPIEYQDDILSAAYVSNLADFVSRSGAKLWIHGHIHTEQNYWIGNTQIICNPRGYPGERNHDFIPDLVMEI